MISNQIFKSISTKTDFLKSAIEANYTDTTLSANQWTFNNIEKSAHINVDSTVRGYSRVELGVCYPGDLIEVEAEILNINGTKAKITIDSGKQAGVSRVDSAHGNYYKKISLKHIVATETNYSVVIGLLLNDAGEIKIRNIRVKISTIRNDKINMTGRKATIHNPNGGAAFEVDSRKHNSDCSIEYPSYPSNAVKIVFDDPMEFDGIPFISQEFHGGSTEYIVRASYGNKNSLILVFYHINDLSTPATLSSLPPNIYANIMLLG